MGLPPQRSHDHAIQLMRRSQPSNIHPYRYPYLKKNEIEKLVQELFNVGVIRPSVSPYSSLVILAHKKDGSWHMCVDFRALNKITIKDKFSILIINELLDELCMGKDIFPSWTYDLGIIKSASRRRISQKIHFALMRTITSSWSCLLDSQILHPHFKF